MSDSSRALIVTAELGKEDFAWLDAQRRAYFPPERNQLSAHLTMFHALPPFLEQEAKQLFGRIAAYPRPRAEIAGLMNLGRGVAYRVVSPELDAIRAEIVDRFRGMLTAQDGQGWRPHVTIQNKVPSSEARALLAKLEKDFVPAPLNIVGLGLHRYLGGPWEHLARWSFRGR